MQALVGTWSGTFQSQSGPFRATDALAPNGQFVTVAQTQTMTMRAWGTYTATQTGPTEFRVERQVQGWMPRQMCAVSNGAVMGC